MKFIIGIILVALLIVGLIAYLVLMLNAREMIFCGDITNNIDGTAAVTRVYTTDFSANETLAEIVIKMNEAEGSTVEIDDLTQILAQYQSIVYSPVFTLSAQQVDTGTYIISGTVIDGLTEKGEPAETDYRYENMRLSAVVKNGKILAAQNVYDDNDDNSKNKDADVFKERPKVIDPIITGEDDSASFALRDCSSFRVIVNNADFANYPTVTFVYSYDVGAVNPLDFTTIKEDSLAIVMRVDFDQAGNFIPRYELAKTVTIDDVK